MTLYSGALKQKKQRSYDRWVMIAITCVIVCSLGFPGNYTKVFGESMKTVIDYTLFVVQIFIMIVLSGDSVGDIRLIDIRPRYWPVYLFLTCIFIVSMFGTSDIKEQLISCIRFSVTALFVLWLCEHLSMENILTVTYHAQICYVAAALAFSVLFPGYYDRPWGQELAFLGMEDTKNVTAQVLCFGILMQLLLWKVKADNRKAVSRFFIPFLIVQIVLMIWSDGRSALLTCVAVAAVIFFFSDRIRMNLGLVCVLVSVLFLIAAMTILPMMEPLLNAIGKDASLSGRIPLWTQILEVIRTNHTMEGYGYGHFWRDKRAFDLIHAGFSNQNFMSHMTAGAHNNILELWLNTGLIGLNAFFVMLIAAFSHPEWMTKAKYLFCLTYMSFYTLVGLTERNWDTYGYKVFFLFLAVGLACQKIIPEEEKAAQIIEIKKKRWGAQYQSSHQKRENGSV